MFDPELRQGQTISNDALSKLFGCGTQGGMRRSHSTNTLIIISDHTKFLYDDKWRDNILHYTGMGQRGDQVLDGNQNSTLYKSMENGVCIHLFEVYTRGLYAYQGRVELADVPYHEIQKDADDKPRRVWMFPMRLVGEATPIIDEKTLEKNKAEKERVIRKLSDEKLLELASVAQKNPSTRKTLSTQFDRNLAVSELAKRRADGKCQLCNQDAPFKNKDGEPYLETHHIILLSRNGEDTISNTVALCPNCHRKMHVLDLDSDRMQLISRNSVH
jgi:5-methylcytosine-specific restriction protein A